MMDMQSAVLRRTCTTRWTSVADDGNRVQKRQVRLGRDESEAGWDGRRNEGGGDEEG